MSWFLFFWSCNLIIILILSALIIGDKSLGVKKAFLAILFGISVGLLWFITRYSQIFDVLDR